MAQGSIDQWQLLNLSGGISCNSHWKHSYQIVDQRDACLGDIHWALFLREQQALQQTIDHCNAAVQEDPANSLPVLLWKLRHIHHLKIEGRTANDRTLTYSPSEHLVWHEYNYQLLYTYSILMWTFIQYPIRFS